MKRLFYEVSLRKNPNTQYLTLENYYVTIIHMHWLFKICLIIAGNAFALWLANLWVPGFVVTTSIPKLILLAFILALLNFILKPILKLIFGPIIILTLGLGLIIVNAAILLMVQYLGNSLDILSGSLSIQGIPALVYSTLIVSAVNFIVHIL
jgi:putative membrane protein